MLRCIVLGLLGLTLWTVTASAQMTMVWQARHVAAETMYEDFANEEGGGNGDRIDAAGFGLFDEALSFPLFEQFGNGQASGTQTSSFTPTELSAEGTAFAEANSQAFDWFAMASGESSMHVEFSLAQASDYTLSGELTAASQGNSFLELRNATTQALIHSANGSGQTPVNFSGNLPAGDYRLFVVADVYVEVDSFGSDVGGSSYDISFQLGGPTAAPILAHLDLEVGPNPVRDVARIAFSSPHSTATNLQVFDARGRRVRQLAANGPSEGRLVWNGRDDAGRRVPRGVYYIQLTAGNETRQRKVSVIR